MAQSKGTGDPSIRRPRKRNASRGATLLELAAAMAVTTAFAVLTVTTVTLVLRQHRACRQHVAALQLADNILEACLTPSSESVAADQAADPSPQSRWNTTATRYAQECNLPAVQATIVASDPTSQDAHDLPGRWLTVTVTWGQPARPVSLTAWMPSSGIDSGAPRAP